LDQQHYVAQVSLSCSSYPKAPHTSHRVGSDARSKAFGEVANTTWAIEGTIWGTLSLFAKKIQKPRDRSQKREEWVMPSQNHSTLQTPKARRKVTSPTSKQEKVSLAPIHSK
jgi:hypothetical protein